MPKTDIPPSFRAIRFCCPHCSALAHQYWSTTQSVGLGKDEVPSFYDAAQLKEVIAEQEKLPEDERYADSNQLPEYLALTEGKIFVSKKRTDPYGYRLYNVDVSTCDSCNSIAIWLNGKMAHPVSGPVGGANPDMPSPVMKLFEEAGAVFPTSPRASAALLRLALQVLLAELGEKGENIAADIDSLLEKGLSSSLIKVMHAVRIIGNESVHPGQISVDDDPEITKAMFPLINEIVEQLITRPREQAELWDMLPESKRKPVEEKITKSKG